MNQLQAVAKNEGYMPLSLFDCNSFFDSRVLGLPPELEPTR